MRSLTEAVVHLVSPGPLELGLALHWVYGFPVLPGTGLKGLARATRQARGDDTESLYGAQGAAGTVSVLDGLPVEYDVTRDVMTPHHPDGYANTAKAPYDGQDPRPIPFLSIAPGAVFELALVAREPATAESDLDAVEADLREGLRERGLGAKTAAGYGVFEIMAHERVGASTGAEPPRPIQEPGPEAAPVDSAATKRAAFEEKLSQVNAIPPSAVAGSIGPFLEWCLSLSGADERRAAATAILAKAGAKYARERAKTKDNWKRILELAQQS